MEEGIRIDDAACEISPQGLEAMLAKQGVELRVTRLDASITEAALNSVIQRRGAPRETPPRVTIADGAVTIENLGDDGRTKVELRASGVRVEIASDSLRLRTEPGP
jgi:hypothetical protein